ncbi:hypothetical protein [Paraburkholderia diazotrophica]|uniref:Uncharacterized protein n=1 Tax=Paraburkholderia diazotrophica TaxID=667676 RepID=A0A1H6S739_9BURK|nr:hypothetical protein [Paraburkholderia diazotrophica]SEI63938.1 hypothetical protein SAMN05192539_1003104 [Paraburkholderia diazotrophica]
MRSVRFLIDGIERIERIDRIDRIDRIGRIDVFRSLKHRRLLLHRAQFFAVALERLVGIADLPAAVRCRIHRCVSHGTKFKRAVGITSKECREADLDRLPEALRLLLDGEDLSELNPSDT